MNKFKSLLTPAALAVASILVVALAMRVRRLNDENAELVKYATHPYAGMFVPAFSSATTDGAEMSVATPRRGRQVLFVFNHTCPYCRASIPAWTRLAAEAEAAGGRGAAVGLSLDAPDTARAYVARHGLRYPVVAFPDRRTAAWYRTRLVPVTMVVDSSGRILFARVGELLEGPVTDSVRVAAGLARAPAASAQR